MLATTLLKWQPFFQGLKNIFLSYKKSNNVPSFTDFHLFSKCYSETKHFDFFKISSNDFNQTLLKCTL